MDYAAGDPVRIAGVLCSAGDMEKHHGAPNDALKLFQLAQIGTETTDPQLEAVITALSATAYEKLGLPAQARQHLQQARRLFGQSKGSSPPFFAFYGNGAGVLAAGEAKLGDYDYARADVTNALRTRPEFDKRCNALDTIVLATTNIQAGEFREGIPQVRQALELVREVGSRRVRDRLEPLEQALLSHRDSTCQDLARKVRQARVPSQAV
jgi:tetratricopeptide (TPR) repeat protein